MHHIKKITLALFLICSLYFIGLSEKYYFDVFTDKRITRVYNKINYVLRFLNDHSFQNQWKHEETPMNPVRLDVVIPIVEKDLEVLPHALSGIRNMIFHPLGKIYLLGRVIN